MAINFSNSPKNLDMTNFRSSLDKMGGISKIARFAVQIRPVGNNVLTDKTYYSQIPDMIYACYQAEYPGRSFETVPVRYYGPTQMFPFNTTYGPAGGVADLSFICRNNSVERQLFDDWQDAINPTTNFNFAYPENYYCDIVMYHFSEIGTNVGTNDMALNYAWTLRKAWPSFVKPQAVTWMDTDFLFLQVEFTYRYWDRSSSVGEFSGETSQQLSRPAMVQSFT